MAKKSKNAWYFVDTLSPLIEISNNANSRQITLSCKQTNSDINSLGTLNATFLASSHARLNLCSTGGDQGGWKTSQFTAVVWLIQNVKQIDKRLVFWCPPLSFAWYFCSFNVTQFYV